MFTFVAFDTETTGTSVFNDEIIEIAAVKFVNGKVADTFQIFVNPQRPIPAGAQKVHGISDEMVADAPLIETALMKFTDFSENAYLVAHNAKFDIRFIGTAATKHDVPLPTNRVFDTYHMSKILLPDLMNHKLENISKQLNISNEGFHRALDDSRFCGQVFTHLLMLLQKKKGTCTIRDILDLHPKELLFPVIEPQPKQLGLF